MPLFEREQLLAKLDRMAARDQEQVASVALTRFLRRRALSAPSRALRKAVRANGTPGDRAVLRAEPLPPPAGWFPPLT